MILLAVEAAFSTEWLLWPAVSAGVVAVATALGLPLGLPGEVLLFAVLTVAATLLSRRLIQRVNPSDSPDINARDGRLIGQRAQVVQAFTDGRGRVFVSGAEWPAELEGEAPMVGESVIVEGIDGPKLKVRAA
ncbi:NfeD family protein [Brevundimonas sp.]|uniref:NfeD family protein n=1 Tax=Brevundimonas sp. TaxID=1871086 RepID=UPI002EDB2FDA